MRSKGTPQELERRRHLAVRRVGEGYSAEEVAGFLGVDPRSVRRWLADSRAGPDGLAARPAPGRPTKLTPAQVRVVLRWLGESPARFGFDSELWTAPRLARLIEQEFGVRFNKRYLADWLRGHGRTPQKPRRVPRERDQSAIDAWRARDWPRVKKRRPARARRSR